MTSVAITPQARDVTISFTDSCNGCCWCCRRSPDPSTKVYVNKHGEAHVFSPTKAKDEREAIRRALSNLQKRIEEVAVDLEKDAHETIRDVEKRSGIQITAASSLDPITLGMIDKINVAIREIRRDSEKSKSTHSDPSVGSPPVLTGAGAPFEESPKEVQLERDDSHRPSSFRKAIEAPKTVSHQEELPKDSKCVLA